MGLMKRGRERGPDESGAREEREAPAARVRRLIGEQNVQHIQLRFTDVLGALKMIEVPVRRLEHVFADGVAFDGSSLAGYAESEECDVVAMPDWQTFAILPGAPGDDRTAFVFCDILDTDLRPFAGDSRAVLRRQLRRVAEMGLTYRVGPELEFFYFRGDGGAAGGRSPAGGQAGAWPAVVGRTTLDEGGYFDATPATVGNEVRRQTVRALGELGIAIETSHHEAAPSQHEVDPRYDEALVMADRLMTMRLVVEQTAAANGVRASFLPKPLRGENGSGMHVHQSLFWGDEVNAFYSDIDFDNLSEIARGFIAGQLAHMREICAVLNQHVGSYRRLIPAYEAPTSICWAHRNRTTLIRVPLHVRGKENSLRVELRNPDPLANPYLAFAVMLAAGLEGIEQGYELPAPVELNVYKLSPAERAALGMDDLPDNLYEAVTELRRSALVRRTLGDHIFERFVTNKLNEWHAFRGQAARAAPRPVRVAR